MKSPPRLAQWILGRSLSPSHRDFVLGDLVERYQAYSDRSAFRADMWYWKQTVTALFVRLPGPAGVERSGFWPDFRVDVAAAVRGLTRRPMQSCTAVLTLGLGIGVAGTAFSILNGTVLRGLPFEEADRLVHFERANHEEDRPSMAVTPHDYVAWRETQSTFEDLGAYVEATALLPVEGAPPERYVGVRISANSFPLLRVTPALGRSFTPDDERAGGPEVVLLSHVLWLNRFGGDPGVVGREIRLNDTPLGSRGRRNSTVT